MGYRERQAHRQQQLQQSLGQGYQSEQRITLPAPRGMNLRDDSRQIADNEALYIDNATPSKEGLRIGRRPTVRAWMASVSAGPAAAELITYEGTTSASDAFFAFFGARIYNVSEVIDSSATATCSFISSPGTLSNTDSWWIQRNDRLIMWTGRGAQPLQYDVTNGWHVLTASVSGAPLSTTWFQGVHQFKSRIYTWSRSISGFAYSSVDQFKGVYEWFGLEQVLGEPVRQVASLSRDGGAGPDDYLVVIGIRGKVAMYAGSNPGDASDWSLVGVYQIGVPAMDKCAVSYGSKLYVNCQDDIYILPDDLIGKHQHTKGRSDRTGSNQVTTRRNGLYWKRKDLLIWGDSTALSVKDGFAFTHVKTGFMNVSGGSADDITAADIKSWRLWHGEDALTPNIGLYKDRLYGARYLGASGPNPIYEIDPDIMRLDPGPAKIEGEIISKPISLQGRTNISMVNPVFAFVPKWSASVSTGTIIYRTAIEYDKEHQRNRQWTDSASADGINWITTTASTNSKGLWTPGFGTGDNAQIRIQVLSASASADLFLKYIDITLSDTGGL